MLFLSTISLPLIGGLPLNLLETQINLPISDTSEEMYSTIQTTIRNDLFKEPEIFLAMQKTGSSSVSKKYNSKKVTETNSMNERYAYNTSKRGNEILNNKWKTSTSEQDVTGNQNFREPYIITQNIAPTVEEEDITKQKANPDKNVPSKKILNRSIFVLPTFRPDCKKGFTLNNKGKCEQMLEVDTDSYWGFILEKFLDLNFNQDDEDTEYVDDFDYQKPQTYEDKYGITRLTIPFF